MKASPKFMLELIVRVDQALWDEFKTYKDVEAYMDRWYETDGNFWSNFDIIRQEDNKNIDLKKTLHEIKDDELLFKIAIDMGLEIPGLVYSIPEIKGILAEDYKTAATTFENALRKVYEEPATSICAANSALESIIKHICADDSIKTCNPRATLFELTNHILKEFRFYPTNEIEAEIRNIASGLLKVAQNIEAMRSKYADTSHGKTADDYIVDDPLYAMYVVNAVTTIGLFLLNFYEKKYLPQKKELEDVNEIPF